MSAYAHSTGSTSFGRRGQSSPRASVTPQHPQPSEATAATRPTWQRCRTPFSSAWFSNTTPCSGTAKPALANRLRNASPALPAKPWLRRFTASATNAWHTPCRVRNAAFSALRALVWRVPDGTRGLMTAWMRARRRRTGRVFGSCGPRGVVHTSHNNWYRLCRCWYHETHARTHTHTHAR